MLSASMGLRAWPGQRLLLVILFRSLDLEFEEMWLPLFLLWGKAVVVVLL